MKQALIMTVVFQDASPILQTIDSDSNMSMGVIPRVQPPEDVNLNSSDMLAIDDDLNLEELMKQKARIYYISFHYVVYLKCLFFFPRLLKISNCNKVQILVNFRL